MARSSSDQAFASAQRRAFVQAVLAELSGRPDDLLCYDDVRRQLHLADPTGSVQVRDIPLDKVVGSVGRYRDFNRAFLPRSHLERARWIRIDRLGAQRTLPPIDVFKVGEVYFVRDGNHRVSVARARGLATIRARVLEIPVRVPLGAGTSVSDLILKAEYTDFLEKTSLDRECPDQHIELTIPGGYESLLQHIEVHQFYTGLRSRHYPALPEATADWYRRVYLPVVERIRAAGILSRFPGRTEADLYLWIAENQARLQMRYRGFREVPNAVDSFARKHSPSRLQRWIRRRRHTPQHASGASSASQGRSL
jgi:uncharacterized ParB-like nuclease family protein